MNQSARFLLLVDDEQNILLALKRELHHWAHEKNIEILTALSAKEGLLILESHGPETLIIISDLKMPEMKGSDFLLHVQKLYPRIVSLLLTGFSESAEIVKAVSAGIFSYMLKPWDHDYLLEEVGKAYDFIMMREQNELYALRLEDELKWAGELQRTILKPQLPASDRVEFRVTYKTLPGLYCGGDYYDVISFSQDRYLLLIGDVEGHGVRAAFVTGILKAVIYPEYIRNCAGKIFSPADFLDWLNSRMSFEFRSTESMLISFFAGVLDLKSMQFTYANAGHTHPCLVSVAGVTELPVSGSPIGFASSIMYKEQVVNLQSGSMLLLYTDGLSKAGTGLSVPEVLRTVSTGPDYHLRVMSKVLETAGSKTFKDDVTILTVGIK